MNLLKTYFAQYRLWIELAAVVILVVAFLWYRHNLIEQGVQKQQESDAKVVAAKTLHNTEVETRAATLAEQHLAIYKATLALPPSPDAPHLQCLQPAPHARSARTMPKNAPTGTGDHAAPESANVVERPSVDIGSLVDTKLRDADALILALQQRIQDEAGVCR